MVTQNVLFGLALLTQAYLESHYVYLSRFHVPWTMGQIISIYLLIFGCDRSWCDLLTLSYLLTIEIELIMLKGTEHSSLWSQHCTLPTYSAIVNVSYEFTRATLMSLLNQSISIVDHVSWVQLCTWEASSHMQ